MCGITQGTRRETSWRPQRETCNRYFPFEHRVISALLGVISRNTVILLWWRHGIRHSGCSFPVHWITCSVSCREGNAAVCTWTGCRDTACSHQHLAHSYRNAGCSSSAEADHLWLCDVKRVQSPASVAMSVQDHRPSVPRTICNCCEGQGRLPAVRTTEQQLRSAAAGVSPSAPGERSKGGDPRTGSASMCVRVGAEWLGSRHLALTTLEAWRLLSAGICGCEVRWRATDIWGVNELASPLRPKVTEARSWREVASCCCLLSASFLSAKASALKTNQHVSPKRLLTSNSLHSVICHKINFFIIASMGTLVHAKVKSAVNLSHAQTGNFVFWNLSDN